MMRIYIPSRGRSSTKFMCGAYTPMRWLRSPRLQLAASYVVRDDEVDKYRRALEGTAVEVLPCGMPSGVGGKRQWIAEYSRDRGDSAHIQCDDDVMLYVRKSAEAFNLRYPETPEVEDLIFRHIPRLLEDYAQVALSCREGNNRVGVGPFPLIQECTRAIRFYAFRNAEYLSIEPNRLPEMMDFDTTLQLLRAGHKNAVLFYWAQGQPGTQLAGGCSTYRTHQSHEEVAMRMTRLHPGLVRLREKKNKSGGEFGTRTEVTVSWKKAWESSQNAE